ncbi:hypothetical protein RUND412_002617 [Rhizina undulata]
MQKVLAEITLLSSYFAPTAFSPPTPISKSLPELEKIVLSSFSNVSLTNWSHYYTSGPHLGGKNISQAEWTRDKWADARITTEIVSYDVFLNYPVDHSLSLDFGNGTIYTPSLEEDVLAEDPTTGLAERIPTFHGYSFSGEAEAEYVFVGYGRKTDFQRLQSLGVEFKGKIALARYGNQFRGLKVRNAQDYGCIGVVIYTDPGDDGNMIESNGYAAYPDGPARNPSSVQRGSVQFLSIYPGDPTTPGYPSKPGVPRRDISGVTPHIPSLPISYADAIPILEALNGHGKSADEVNITNWKGGLNVSYSTGPAPGNVLKMANQMDDQITPIWNVVGIINGTIEDEVVVIGNHRDAWIAGGAGDPNSGSAVLVEIARAYGKLLETGWKPRRTIVLASWDAEEYGLVGSTEWFEEYVTWAVPNVVAYLNVDVAVSGPNLVFAGVPEIHDIVKETLKKVQHPVEEGKTLYDVWAGNNGTITPLGSGSDYTAFVHSGIASLDMGFKAGSNDPIYHYHSNFDSFHWMTTYGDPGFIHHKAAGQFLALLGLNIAEQEVIPFNSTTYAQELEKYYAELETVVAKSGLYIPLYELQDAIKAFTQQAKKLEEWKAEGEVEGVNQRLKLFERGFVSQGGLPGREFYKHVVYAPGLDTGYAPTTFPGITEAVNDRNATLAAEWVKKTSRAVMVAAGLLAP